MHNTGWSTKMSPFFSGNNLYKNKETFKIFSPQIPEVYTILLVETTLESIMFYYTFSVNNTMFFPYTGAAVWQQSSNSNIKTVHNSIEDFFWSPSDFFSDDVPSCLWFVFTNSIFQVLPQKIVRRFEILGIEWLGVMSVSWEVMPEVFIFLFCSRNEALPHFSNRILDYFRHNFPWERHIPRKTDNL